MKGNKNEALGDLNKNLCKTFAFKMGFLYDFGTFIYQMIDISRENGSVTHHNAPIDKACN